MGQFESRAEDPLAWAGLPSEPLERSDETALDAEVSPADAIGAGLGSRESSIVIPVAPYLAEAKEPDAGDADRDEDTNAEG
jgi:hypothetical protein